MSKLQGMMGTSDRLVPIRSAQVELSTSRTTIDRMIASGCLKSVRVGRAVRIPESSIRDFIERGGERNIQQATKQQEG